VGIEHSAVGLKMPVAFRRSMTERRLTPVASRARVGGVDRASKYTQALFVSFAIVDELAKWRRANRTDQAIFQKWKVVKTGQLIRNRLRILRTCQRSLLSCCAGPAVHTNQRACIFKHEAIPTCRR
jgi:hypothetical protein